MLAETSGGLFAESSEILMFSGSCTLFFIIKGATLEFGVSLVSYRFTKNQSEAEFPARKYTLIHQDTKAYNGSSGNTSDLPFNCSSTVKQV